MVVFVLKILFTSFTPSLSIPPPVNKVSQFLITKNYSSSCDSHANCSRVIDVFAANTSPNSMIALSLTLPPVHHGIQNRAICDSHSFIFA